MTSKLQQASIHGVFKAIGMADRAVLLQCCALRGRDDPIVMVVNQVFGENGSPFIELDLNVSAACKVVRRLIECSMFSSNLTRGISFGGTVDKDIYILEHVFVILITETLLGMNGELGPSALRACERKTVRPNRHTARQFCSESG